MGRRSGWRNTWSTSDPQLRRTLDSVSDWSRKLGAGVTVKRANADMVIPTGGLFATNVPFDTAVSDEWNFFSGGLVTIPEKLDGVYLAVASALWDIGAHDGSRREIRIADNALFGTPFATDTRPGLATLTWGTAVAGQMRLRAGDSVYLGAYQDSGAPLDLKSFSGTGIYMNLTRVGDYRDWDGE
jgi:hypothetical protein